MDDPSIVEKLQKLPKWAQEHIQTLVRKVESLEEDITIRSNKIPESERDFLIILGETEIYTPKFSHLEIPIGPDRFDRIGIYRKNDKEIYVRILSSDRLLILPEVTNSVVIKAEREHGRS